MEYPRNDELLSAYLDRELSPDERAAMDRLLEKSPEARQRLRELEVTSRFVRRLPQHGVEADLADGVLDRLRSESLLRPAPVEPVRRSPRVSWRISGPLAAAAAILAAVWLFQAKQSRTSLDTDAQAAWYRWEQVKEGDFFELVGPEGENPFQLIVLNKDSDSDAIRCLLVDKSDPLDDMAGATSNSPLALQADREQLDALIRAYVQANSIADEPLPVVDIYASAQPEGFVVGDVKPHSRRWPGRPQGFLLEQDKMPAEEPSEQSRGSSGSAASELAESASVARHVPPEASEVPFEAQKGASVHVGSQSEAKTSASGLADEEQRKSEAFARAPAPPARSALGGTNKKAERTQAELERVQPDDSDKSAPKTTRASVRDMVELNVRHSGGDPKKQSRVEVLLQFVVPAKKSQ